MSNRRKKKKYKKMSDLFRNKPKDAILAQTIEYCERRIDNRANVNYPLFNFLRNNL